MLTPFQKNQKNEVANLEESWAASLDRLSPDTRKAYMGRVNRAAPLVAQLAGQGPVAPLTPEQAEDVLAALATDASPATVRLTQAALSSLYRYAAARGYQVPNPWPKVRVRRERSTIAERILTEKQVGDIIRAATPGLSRLLVLFLYYTGCRVSGACGVRGRDFRVERDEHGKPQVRVTLYEKGGKTRWVVVSPPLWDEICRVRPRLGPDVYLFPFSRKRGWERMKRAAKAAGIPDASPHWLRHSAASHALAHGASLPDVSRWLGHARITTTMVYVHASGADAPRVLRWMGD